MTHMARLLDAGLPGEQIGVITPYNGQVAALRELRGNREAAVEISSVDGFQGMHVVLVKLLWAIFGSVSLHGPLGYALPGHE